MSHVCLAVCLPARVPCTVLEVGPWTGILCGSFASLFASIPRFDSRCDFPDVFDRLTSGESERALSLFLRRPDRDQQLSGSVVYYSVTVHVNSVTYILVDMRHCRPSAAD